MTEREVTNEDVEALAQKISDCIDYDMEARLAVFALGSLIAALLHDVLEEDPELARTLGSMVARITLNAAAGGSVQ
jgi:hypothetical protein